jgi:2-polyprenyl-3-methyl-5-hydroxy-6-metoxy-1,4-benzoquinol methylase
LAYILLAFWRETKTLSSAADTGPAFVKQATQQSKGWTMFDHLSEINARPAPFGHYTTDELWTDEYTSSQMLKYHLDGTIDLSSRKTAFIDRSAQYITTRFGLAAGKRVADFGCGPGLYTSRLAASGAKVSGIDFSGRSLKHAREQAEQKGLAIEYIQADYLEFETDARFDLITMIMCDFCVLSPSQRKIMLQKFHRLLEPGGAVLLDAYTLAGFAQREQSATYAADLLNGFWSPDPYFGFLTVFLYEAEKVVLDKYTIVEQARTRTIYNWLQYFDRESLKAEFEEAGLTIQEFLGNVAGDSYDSSSPEFAVIATKPAS